MVEGDRCQYSSNCRIFEVNSASDIVEDVEFVRNCCNGAEKEFCPIFRYHQALRHPPASRIPQTKEDMHLHLIARNNQ